MPVLLIALAVLTGIQSESGDGGDRPHLNTLSNRCRPVEVLVAPLDDDAKGHGLVEKDLRKTAATLLEADGLYTESGRESGHRLLYVRVLCSTILCVLKIEFAQYAADPGSLRRTITPLGWEYRKTVQWASYQLPSRLVFSHLVRGVEKFQKDYRRVNEKDCPR